MLPQQLQVFQVDRSLLEVEYRAHDTLERLSQNILQVGFHSFIGLHSLLTHFLFQILDFLFHALNFCLSFRVFFLSFWKYHDSLCQKLIL